MNWQESINEKIFDAESIKPPLARWRLKGQKIVFTNGCFDIMHLGHISYLSQAASLGDKLIVGLNTDRSVQAIKGSQRPIQDEKSRSQIMASLAFVSAVILFDNDTPLNLIELIRPEILVKGGDYTVETVVGADFVIKNGGEVKLLEFIPGYSTSALEKKIRG